MTEYVDVLVLWQEVASALAGIGNIESSRRKRILGVFNGSVRYNGLRVDDGSIRCHDLRVANGGLGCYDWSDREICSANINASDLSPQT
jgi:hypothetical protein